MIAIGNCLFEAETGLLTNDHGVPLELRPQATEVLRLLVAANGEVVSKNALMDAGWPETIVTEDSLYQCITEIRRVLPDGHRDKLQTVPRKGYRLVTREVSSTQREMTAAARHSTIPRRSWSASWQKPMAVVAVLALVLIGWLPNGGYTALFALNENHDQTDQTGARENLTVMVLTDDEGANKIARRLTKTVATALSRYSNIEPIAFKDDEVTQIGGSKPKLADYRLELNLLDEDGGSVNAQLFHQATNALVIAENFDRDSASSSGDVGDDVRLSGRIAALIGSPTGGAIGRHLMNISRKKPVAELTRPECLAHGYGCTSCTGELSNITPKAKQCLANLLENDPQDPDAWALQSTVYAQQYFMGAALQEPMRSDKSKRNHFIAKAVEAATRAESLADGTNPSVYWGMVQAYLASCDADKMQVAVNRGLQINPDDPTMLAVFGNFLSFVGKWDEGKALIEEALEKEPKLFEDWWYMALAKWHYRQGEYHEAYDYFLKSFGERNWLSHLQLTYTLPHLGRIEKARQSLEDFNRMAPSMTRENAYEFYQSYCFDDAYLARMKTAFDLIEMPSRGSGDDFEAVRPVRATVEKIGDRQMEYVDVGEGIPVVFVHGDASDYRTWGYMLLPISEKYRYLALTSRFFGTLDWPKNDPTIDVNVDVQDIIAFIETKKLGPVYVVGWSSSGDTVSALARKRPDLLRGIVFYEPVNFEFLDPSKNPNPPRAEEGLDFSAIGLKLDERDLEGAVKIFFEIALERKHGEFETEPPMLQRTVLDAARTLPLTWAERAPDQPVVDCDYVKEITVPGLILHGERTNRPWRYISQRYEDCHPSSQLFEVKGANHDGPISQPQQIADFIDAFIRKTESLR